MSAKRGDPKLSKYENEQIKGIVAWKKEEPGVVSKAFGIAIEPAAWLLRKLVPQKAIQGTIDGANSAAVWMTDVKDIKRDAEITEIEELRHGKLERCDDLANNVHNWAIGLAVTEGAATGVFGLFGAPVDIPAIITLALRTIHKTGVCYGYECKSDIDKNFALGVLAASGANSVEEKTSALALLTAIRNILAKVTWKKMTEKAAEQQLSKEAAVVAIRNLAKQLGVNITKRRAMAAIPMIGAAVGGSVNGWYIKEVGWAARRAFQERWLTDNGKIEAGQ
jgi:hypothetical protein